MSKPDKINIIIEILLHIYFVTKLYAKIFYVHAKICFLKTKCNYIVKKLMRLKSKNYVKSDF